MLSRRAVIVGGAAVVAQRSVAATLPDDIVMTGHLGNIGSRLWPLIKNHSIGIDKKDGSEFDLGDARASWRNLLRKDQTVIHLAAHAAPQGPWDKIGHDNFAATAWLVDACIEAKVNHIIFASSIWRHPRHYGHPAYSESDDTTPYGLSKRYGEELLFRYASEGKIKATSIVIGYAPMLTLPTDPWLRSIMVTTDDLKRDFLGAVADESPGYRHVEMVGRR